MFCVNFEKKKVKNGSETLPAWLKIRPENVSIITKTVFPEK